MFKLEDFKIDSKSHQYIDNLADMDKDDERQFLEVGITKDDMDKSATFIQKDNNVVHCSKKEKGVEIIGIIEAAKKYPELQDYMWKNIAPDKDEFVSSVKKQEKGGYFVRSDKNAFIKNPVQTCLNISSENLLQNVHNVVVAEENSNLHIITGCLTSHNVKSALHVGVSEFYVKKGATLTYTMIHDWGEKISVRPRTCVTVEEGGSYISNYICLKPVYDLQTNPIIYLNGENAVARSNSILFAEKGSNLDVGGIVVLNAKNTRAEIISRAIVKGGTITARGKLIGNCPSIKAHLECKGMILEEGNLLAIPELEASVADLEMSHEAAVGKIDNREIEYLMSRKLSEEEAISTIVRGFLNVEIEGLPKDLRARLDRLIDKTQEAAI